MSVLKKTIDIGGVSLKTEFNDALWFNVQLAREALGLPRFQATDVDSPLVGKVLRNVLNGKEYTVEWVRKEWRNGWYKRAMMDCNGSHVAFVVENESSINPDVLTSLQSYNDTFFEGPEIMAVWNRSTAKELA